MEKINHWNEANTTALIQGISGIAGNIIANKNAGNQISQGDAQVAYLAQQTAAALGQANQQQTAAASGLQGNTIIYIAAGIAIIIIGVVLFKKK